jgi:hypothetical protein
LNYWWHATPLNGTKALQLGYELLLWNAFALPEPDARLHVWLEALYVASPDHCQLTEPRGTGMELARPELQNTYIVVEKGLSITSVTLVI